MIKQIIRYCLIFLIRHSMMRKKHLMQPVNIMDGHMISSFYLIKTQSIAANWSTTHLNREQASP